MIILKLKLMLIILFSLMMSTATATEVCEQANELLYQAYDLYSKNHVVSKQTRLLKRALQLCPDMPEIHNSLAFVLENSGEYSQAIKHYKRALTQKADFYEAWYDLGELYYEQNQFILSLDAHSQICKIDPDAKARIKQLLTNRHYAVINSDQIISQENLLLLYDPKSNSKLNNRLLDCEINLIMQPIVSFYNFKFQRAILRSGNKKQLDQIATTLRQLYNGIIKIHSYTDTFTNMVNRNELNLKLSQERATAIANALVERGISIERIQAIGHGYHKPIAYGISSIIKQKNTRIEIEIQYFRN